MGEYSNLYIGHHYITGWKDGVGYEISALFSKDDVTTTPHPKWNENWVDDPDEQPEELTCFQYETTAGNIIDRLDLLGYTMEAVEQHWDTAVAQHIEGLGRFWRERHEGKIDPENLDLDPDYQTGFYQRFTLEVWCTAVRRLFNEDLLPDNLRYGHKADIKMDFDDPDLHRIVSNWRHGFPAFGFPGWDEDYQFSYFLRALLSVLDQQTLVILDCSALAGWEPETCYTCLPPQAVLLTEGSTDMRVLESTLRFRKPHLIPYFHFIDFDAVKMSGSAGHLLTVVRAFAATGVQRPTIAIFDNDAAGHDAFRQLKSLALPDLLRAITLPSLELGMNYPTIGPQGVAESDINGSACSIELYLGKDILTLPSGKLALVKYTTFLNGIERWQGEVEGKRAIQERYARFLVDAGDNPELGQAHDWAGTDAIFNYLFQIYGELYQQSLVLDMAGSS